MCEYCEAVKIHSGAVLGYFNENDIPPTAALAIAGFIAGASLCKTGEEGHAAFDKGFALGKGLFEAANAIIKQVVEEQKPEIDSMEAFVEAMKKTADASS